MAKFYNVVVVDNRTDVAANTKDGVYELEIDDTGAAFKAGTATSSNPVSLSITLNPDNDFTLRACTAANLAGVESGPAGAGHTITAGSNGALVVDDITLRLNDSFLLNNTSGGSSGEIKRGPYVVVNPGSVSTKWVIQRDTHWDTAAKSEGLSFFRISEGTVNAGKIFAYNFPNGVNFGVDHIEAEDITAGPQVTKITGLDSTFAGGIRAGGVSQFDNDVVIAGSLTIQGSVQLGFVPSMVQDQAMVAGSLVVSDSTVVAGKSTILLMRTTMGSHPGHIQITVTDGGYTLTSSDVQDDGHFDITVLNQAS